MTKRSKKVKHARTVDGSMICIAESEECVREINELWLNNTRTRIMEFMGTKPMTKLEEEIWIAVNDEGARKLKANELFTEVDRAKAAAEVARRYIEEAIYDAVRHGWEMEAGSSFLRIQDFSKKWLKENGITE